MSSKKPHIVVVMGSFQIPYHYRFLKTSLENASYGVTVVNLASTVTDDPPKPVADAMAADITVIRDTVKRQIDANNDVAVLAHSWGGVPASAALEGLRKVDSNPGVTKIIYLAAILLPPGVSAADIQQGNEPPFIEIQDDLQFVKADPIPIFYSDVPTAIAEDAAKHIYPNSRNIVNSSISYVAWKDIPSVYIICEKDPELGPAVSDFMITNCEVPCQIVRIESGHSPYLSMPDRLASIVRWAAGEEGVDLEGVKFDSADAKA